jgi:hypothetical protein
MDENGLIFFATNFYVFIWAPGKSDSEMINAQ